MKITGIYKILNISNNKFYIGSAKDIHQRWNIHKSLLNQQKHHNSYLQNAWNKYGEENFKLIVIEEVLDVSILLDREQFWLDTTNACDKGYNLQPIAHSSLGRILSDETKDKIRLKSVGRKLNKETRLKMSESQSGKNNGMYGRNHNTITKQKISESKKGTNTGKENHFYGKKHTEETKIKISKANRGNKGNSKLTISDVIEIKKKIKNKDNSITYDSLYNELAVYYSVSASCIRKIKIGERWEDVNID